MVNKNWTLGILVFFLYNLEFSEPKISISLLKYLLLKQYFDS